MRFIPVILFLLWAAGWFWFTNNMKNNCCGASSGTEQIQSNNSNTNNTSSSIAETAIKSGPLWFNWSGDEAKTSDRFSAYRDSVLSTVADGDILQIIGNYYADEEYSGSHDNLGLARAHAAKDLFADHIEDDRLELNSNLLSGKSGDGDLFYNGLSYRSRKPAATVTVSEVGNSAEIRFPRGSNQKLNDPKIEKYLSDVADRVKKSGERIRLTGHTDDESSAEFNMGLGMRRAQAIKNILVAKGVSGSKISVNSKGETAPIASNSTEAGKQQNRRTELEIIK